MKASTRFAFTKTERCGRRLVVVDIENVVGGACIDADTVRWARDILTTAADLKPGDLIVIGTSHVGYVTIACNWPNLRYVVRSGADGADLALLEVLAEDVPARFGELVLISGDRIFADTVSALGGEGVSVTVIAHRERLSTRLKLAAAHVLYLNEPTAAIAAAHTAKVA